VRRLIESNNVDQKIYHTLDIFRRVEIGTINKLDSLASRFSDKEYIEDDCSVLVHELYSFWLESEEDTQKDESETLSLNLIIFELSLTDWPKQQVNQCNIINLIQVV